MERLYRQVQETQRLLSDPETDWKDCSASIEELATAVESLRRAESYKDAVRLLLSLSAGIGVQLSSIRSKLVKDVCEHLLRIVKVTGQDFQEMANVLMPQIVSTAKSSSAAIRQPGAKLLCKLSETVRYDVGLMRKIFLQLTQDKVRVLLLEQLRIILVYWSDDELTQWISDMLEMVRRGLEDQNAGVRSAAREVLTRISSHWRERVDEFVDMPSIQSKTLIISEHRDSLLAQAIAEKYPELVNKSEALARSRGSFMKSRYKSPRHKKSEQNVEIHVATPPPKQRDDQGATMQEAVSSEVGIDIESVATFESSRREKTTTSRRLFVDTNTFDDLDDDEKKDIPEVFDGSQMHGYRSTSVMQEAEVLALLESAQISTGEPTILSQTTVARSTTASSIDEVLPHPGVTKLKESKIPSPLNRSPSFLSKKRLESPTGSGSSPHLRPSLLPRPGSFSLKSQGGSGTSTPAAAASVEEDKIEPKPLSASDEFFSKPIPSSMATPTPPLQPADNVTIRPKRRAFFNQEQEEESLPQVFAPVPTSFEIPAEEFTQTLHVDTTPEGLVEETATRLREKQYSGYTSDDVDDLSHLTEGSDQVESDTEWNRRRLDEGESRSDNDDESAHGDAGHAEFRGGDDAFPDDWRLEEGPRHQFDFEDEIGNRLSDDEAKAGSDGEIEPTVADPNGSSMEWLQHAESSPNDELSRSGGFEEEECHEEVEPDSLPKDTLEALLSVRDEMTRLRAITRTDENSVDVPVKERYAPSSHANDPSHTAEQVQQQFLDQHEAQPRDEPERPYLARLQDADRFARSPLLSPPTDDVPDESTERNILNRLPSLERFGQIQQEAATFDEATTFDDYHESSSEHDDLDLQAHSPSPPLVPEQAGALIDSDKREEEPIDFMKEFRPAEIDIPRSESDFPAPQATAQPQEAAFVHEELEHAGRFDAAEKLFAAKKTSPPYGYYDRPHSPEPELYMHSEPYHERLPPTQMGAILNPVMSPTSNMITADPSESINAEEEEPVETPSVDPQTTGAAPQPDLKQTQPETSVPEREPTLPTDENKPGGSQLHPEGMARPVSTPHTTAPQRNVKPATLGWASSIGISVVMLIAAVFCMAGILHAAKTVSESREYHQALKTRIDMFEASIAESHEKVLKLEEDYAIWSDYVRKLTQDDEANALRQLEAIQVEVQKWQQDMKADLVQFRQALSVDSIEAAFADLRANKTNQTEQ